MSFDITDISTATLLLNQDLQRM